MMKLLMKGCSDWKRIYIYFQTCVLEKILFGALMTYCQNSVASDIHQTSASHHQRHANKLTSRVYKIERLEFCGTWRCS